MAGTVMGMDTAMAMASGNTANARMLRMAGRVSEK